MTEPLAPWEPTADQRISPVEGESTPKLRRWPRIVGAIAAALVVGAGIGVGVYVSVTDPTESEEYQGLQAALDDAEAEIGAAEEATLKAKDAAEEASDRARQAVNELASRRGELDARDREIAAREEAVAGIEARIVQTSIPEGIWTVGVDVEPGTYRTAEPLSGYCYWAILRSGTNGSDIVDNDGPEGGFPTVTLSAGQDFENSGCGTFRKQ
jgi:hypothetical protein